MGTLFHDVVSLGRAYPVLVIYLSLAGGYFIGKIKIFKFNLGSTAGVLIVALILGQIGVQIPTLIKTIAFALFIYAIGYKVGPEFFGSLKKEGLNYIWLSLFVAVVGLLTAALLGRLFGFDQGTTAGLLGGAMTQSSIIGTADGAIKHLAVSSAQKAVLESNVAIAYAITYIFGTAGLVIFFKLISRIMGINLKKEAKLLEQEMSGASDDLESPDLFSWHKRVVLREYSVQKNEIIGKTLGEIEAMFSKKVAIDQVRREGKSLKIKADLRVQCNDVVALAGSREALLQANTIIGTEIVDSSAPDIIGEIISICILNKDAAGKTLGEISEKYGHGCFLKSISRQGHELPLTKNTVVKKCDVLKVAGAQKDIEKFIQYLGYAERTTPKTDLIMVGLGCAFGTLLGLISIPAAGIPITLGVGGGVLIAGLIFGWLRTLHPTFGEIPNSAQWIFTDLGLNLFIACVGLTAGPQALHALQQTGISLLAAGVILTLTPMILGIIFGKWILRLNPVLLFGALTGAGTVTAALNALKEEANSTAPALGYTVPYAFGNVLLTIWGTIIVHLVH